MAEISESGDDVIPLNEESQIALPLDENLNEESQIGLPSDENLNEESQIALPSDENERRLAVPVVIPSFSLNKGSFDRANFGPQTNTKHVEANTIEHATITHVHHHYGGDDKSDESPSTSGVTAARTKQELEGFVQVTDNIFMNTKKPLKEGTKIYEGYQEHVTGQRKLLAIKAIFPCTKKSIREVQHLVTLAPHPNVVQIIWSKEQQTPLPTLYIAMELCGLKNLHDYLNENRDKNTSFDFKKNMSYSNQLVKAMKHIHHNRIIHGDLKPENILFSMDGDQIKISDFGIGKELRKSRSSTKRSSQGTDGYRAPETYNSDIISMKADVHSLGVTLYSLWTNGKHPFGPNPYRWIVNIIDNTGRDLSGLPEEMGAKKDEFLDLLDKMLQFDPENRPTIEAISKHPFFSRSQTIEQGPTVNVSDSYPSSEIWNAIVDGINAGRKNSIVDKLDVWRVIVESEGDSTSVIRNMNRGCRICLSQPEVETRFRSEKVKINGEERLISELNKIELPVGHFSSSQAKRELDIVVWFDHETLQLFATNLTSFHAEYRITSNLDPDSHFSPLPEKISTPIFSIKEFVGWIERKKHEGGQVTGEEGGVEMNLQWFPAVYTWFHSTVFKIQIIPVGILQFH